MIQKVHNFEISKISQTSYVQYLQLLSQIILNCQSCESGVTTDISFLVENFNEYLNVCVQEDPRKKLMNSGENAQKNMIYQFFFINYLISISQHDIITKSFPNEVSEKSE